MIEALIHKGRSGTWCLTEQIPRFLFASINYFVTFGLAPNCKPPPTANSSLPIRNYTIKIPSPSSSSGYGKVVSSVLQWFIDTFTNSNTWHHNNILAPPIQLVRLKDGLDIKVRFTRTGFHFYLKVDWALGARNQYLRQRKVLALLNFVNVLL